MTVAAVDAVAGDVAQAADVGLRDAVDLQRVGLEVERRGDAAAAVVLMEKGAAQKKGLKPMARLVAYGHAGVDPKPANDTLTLDATSR